MADRKYSEQELKMAEDIAEIKTAVLYLKSAEEKRDALCDDCQKQIDDMRDDIDGFKTAVKVVGSLFGIGIAIFTFIIDIYFSWRNQ